MKTIRLNGDINDYSRWYLEYELAKVKGEEVTVIINSLGGRVDCAIAMRQMLQNHGKVTAEIVGFVASAATFLALGAEKVVMHSTSMWLAHKCSLVTDVYGALNADDLANVIAKLESQKKMQEAVDANIAGIYFSFAQSKGKTLANVCDMMKEATWMSADQCKEWGFIDDIIDDKCKRGKVSNSLQNLMNAYQLPIPTIEGEDGEMVKDTTQAPEDKMPSWMEKVINKVMALIPEDKQLENDLKTQLSNVTNELKRSKALVTNLQGEIAKYKALVDSLNGLGDSVKNAELQNKVDEIRKVIDAAVTPALQPSNSSEKMDFSDIAKDPVNSYSE